MTVKRKKRARILLSLLPSLCYQRVKKLHYVSCFLVRLICRPIVKLCIGWMLKQFRQQMRKNTQKNTLQLALQNKIKLFYRPENLPVQPGKARNMLRFKYEGKQLKVINPSPYYLTLTGIKVQGSKLPNMFVPPKKWYYGLVASDVGWWNYLSNN